MTDIIERIESKEITVHLAGYRGVWENDRARKDTEELIRLANLGAALLSQRDELEHLTKEHGFYCLQGLLALIEGGDNNG